MGFIESRRDKDRIIDFTSINEGLEILKIREKFFNICLFRIHIPTEDKKGKNKEKF